MFTCQFCLNDRKSKKSLSSHERLCSQNPNKATTPFQNLDFQRSKNSGNQYTNGSQTGHSEETKRKMSVNSTGRKHSDAAKAKLSEHAKRNGLGGVTQSRWIQYQGKMLGSSYELRLAQDLDKHNIKWDTCSRFTYIDPNGKSRTYTPDIYLVEYDVYLDPKNDFLIREVNPALGFNDCVKIGLVMQQNGITIHVLNKEQLTWEHVKTLL